MQQYLTTNDIAARFGISVRTVWEWLGRPDLKMPRPTRIGKKNFFDKDQIAEWEAALFKAAREAA